MAASDFLTRFRFASLFVRPRSDIGDQPPTADQIEEAKKYAHLWLTPSAVEGFDLGRFRHLSADERAELTAAVRRFEELAAQVPPGGPPPDDVVRDARQQLVTIRRFVKPALHDWQSWQTVKEVDRIHSSGMLPEWVVGYDAEVGIDYTGDPAVWVTLVVTDEMAVDPRLFPIVPRIREVLADSLEQRAINRIVYVDFRSVGEYLDPLAGVEAE